MKPDEIAISTGSESIAGSDRIPIGCGIKDGGVYHDPVKGPLADLARELYYAGKLSEYLAHQGTADARVLSFAQDIGKYANDLEFYARQLGLAMKVPTMVRRPYLPVDAAMPLPLLALPPPPSRSARSSGGRCTLPPPRRSCCGFL
eukprot:TRINITY_DN51209_c0_g1_i1.p1 TRINITY_DN51209_c0_g1~~TRINITY_DN51209_c0_g1_i1.p1  ORF type:complete len:146 (+),score=28.98 TRINITY_DN51209_c0_g1_i1:137-574(+)